MVESSGRQYAAKVLDTCHLVMRTIGGEMRRRSPNALSIRQIIALMAIRDERGASLSEISDRLGGSISGASKLVDALVELGYVERATAGDDRRRVTLALTPEGNRILVEVSLEELSILSEKLTGLTAGECSMVELVMDLLRKTLSAGVPSPAAGNKEKEEEPPPQAWLG